MATDAELTAPIALSARIAKEKPVLRAKYGSRWLRGPATDYAELSVVAYNCPAERFSIVQLSDFRSLMISTVYPVKSIS
jgi:hypothetical protein